MRLWSISVRLAWMLRRCARSASGDSGQTSAAASSTSPGRDWRRLVGSSKPDGSRASRRYSGESQMIETPNGPAMRTFTTQNSVWRS